MNWKFIKTIVKPIYRIGNTAVNATLDPYGTAYDVVKWVDPTGAVERVEGLIDTLADQDPTGLLGKYKGEALQIGLAIITANPEAAIVVVENAVKQELYKRSKNLVADFFTAETPHNPPPFVTQNPRPINYTPTNYNQGHAIPQSYWPEPLHPAVAELGNYMDMHINMMRQVLYMRYMMQMQYQFMLQQQMAMMMQQMATPMWYWWLMPHSRMVGVVCPFVFPPQIPPHMMFIPQPVFWATRGKWTQCGMCFNWSFTP